MQNPGSMNAPALFHTAFYRFVRIDDPAQVAAVLREQAHGLLGSVLVAREGISGAVSGTASQLDRFEHALHTDARLAALFDALAFLRTSLGRTAPFHRLKVHVRAEVLPLGVAGVDAVGRRGRQLSPPEWRALLDAGDALVIDNRNGFEHRLGRFRGALDPQVDNFRDFPAFVDAHAEAWRTSGRRVAMYCTGGIRCEKAAAWMHDAHGLEVLQLEGGILRYLAEMPGAARDWHGDCFVFDNRLALNAGLQQADVTAEQVYGGVPDEAWRLRRAQRLAAADADADAVGAANEAEDATAGVRADRSHG
jgi:UPF0176 protein